MHIGYSRYFGPPQSEAVTQTDIGASKYGTAPGVTLTFR